VIKGIVAHCVLGRGSGVSKNKGGGLRHHPQTPPQTKPNNPTHNPPNPPTKNHTRKKKGSKNTRSDILNEQLGKVRNPNDSKGKNVCFYQWEAISVGT